MDKLSNIERREPNSGYKQKIIEAIKSKDKELLITALEEINKALTGGWPGFDNEVRKDDEEITRFLKDLDEGREASAYIYLGDGAISRLVLRAEGNQIDISLGQVSSDKVKQRFEKLQ